MLWPNSEIVEPNRAKDRRDSELPRRTESKPDMRERVVKVIDFGLAKQLQKYPATGRTVPLDSGGPAGKPFYMAPEVCATPKTPPGTPYPNPEAIDMWALGVTIMILLTGQPPMELAGWNRQRRLDPRYVMITAGDGGLERLITSWRMDAKMPPIVIDLVAALLQLNPSNRPSASQVLQHPFLTEAGLAQALAEAEEAQARYDAEAHK